MFHRRLSAAHRLAIATAGTLAFTASAHAIDVRYSFTGKVARLPAPISSHIVTPGFASLGIAAGDIVTGSFTYDTTGIDGSPTPEVGFYIDTVRALTVTIAGHTWSHDFQPGMNFVQIDNDWKIPAFVAVNPGYSVDKFTIETNALTGPVPSTLGARPLESTSLVLDLSAVTPAPSDTPFSSPALPASLDYAHFTTLHQGYFTYTFFDASNRFVFEAIRFDIDSLSPAAPVPEPGTLLTMACGLVALAGWQSRRPSR